MSYYTTSQRIKKGSGIISVLTIQKESEICHSITFFNEFKPCWALCFSNDKKVARFKVKIAQ